jgi:BirA family biotin operon repressor/biotin-[acetyl-CoA-carboxylase] ligase
MARNPRIRLNPVDPSLRDFAQEQRSAMTRAEALFWNAVRAHRFEGYKFKRQVPIAPYVVDFLCTSARVVVELDGPPHDKEDRRRRDEHRDRWLKSQGFTVLRFSNDLVLGNLGLVLEEVRAAIESQDAPSPGPR